MNYFEYASLICSSIVIENLQDFGLVVELWIFGGYFLNLYCEFLVAFVVGAENLTEGTRTEFLTDDLVLSVGLHAKLI